MKVDKVTINAVVPVQQYGNIQPGIEIVDVEDTKDAIEHGMGFIKELFQKHSEVGPLNESEAVVKIGVEKTSFNEGVKIVFEETEHTYKHNGNPLVNASLYIEQFYKKFDSNSVSKSCAKAWGVDQKELKGFWDANGYVSSGFGTVVHNVLEIYDRFKALGEKVKNVKKDQEVNYALPKHPILKNIVDGFLELDSGEGKVVPEALITNIELGLCGHADRVLILDEKKKICRIQDYKINIGSEEIKKDLKAKAPFNELPANKITKYQIQMSFYANLMQKSGWTVEGLDVFVYEDKWKHHKLEVLNVI